MALIKCPECGREISDKSSYCIHCGYPLNLHNSSSKNPLSGEYYEFDFMYPQSEGEIKKILQNKNSRFYSFYPKTETSGSYESDVRNRSDPYYSEEDNIYEIDGYRVSVSPFTYLFNSSYLVMDEDLYFYKGLIPEGNTFDACIENNSESIYFKKDGFFIDNGETGLYYRSGEFIIRDHYYDEANWKMKMDIKYYADYYAGRSVMLVFSGRVPFDWYIHSSKVSALESLLYSPPIKPYWEKSRNESRYNTTKGTTYHQKRAPWDTNYYNSPCPYCGQYMVRPAKWEDKRLAISFWGALHTSKTGARFKCDNCKKMWS